LTIETQWFSSIRGGRLSWIRNLSDFVDQGQSYRCEDYLRPPGLRTRGPCSVGLCRAALYNKRPTPWIPLVSQLLRAILPQRIWLYISPGGWSAISTRGSAVIRPANRDDARGTQPCWSKIPALSRSGSRADPQLSVRLHAPI